MENKSEMMLMNIFDKIRIEEYCNLYSKWFNEEKPISKDMNTKNLLN